MYINEEKRRILVLEGNSRGYNTATSLTNFIDCERWATKDYNEALSGGSIKC